MKERLSNENSLIKHLCFSDEATFRVNAVVNKHNCVILGYENPKLYTEVSLKSAGVSVWAAMFRHVNWALLF